MVINLHNLEISTMINTYIIMYNIIYTEIFKEIISNNWNILLGF